MSPIQTGTISEDRFGRAYRPGARIIYPTRRGSDMELIEATIIGVGVQGTNDGYGSTRDVLFARRKSGTKVTLKNLWDVVVIPR